MKVVLDTNILVSFFRPNPVSEIISKSKSFNLHLFSPEYAIEELKKNKQDVLKYSGFTPKQFDEKLSKLIAFVKIIPKDSFKEFKSEAKQLAPHDKDIPIFALALKLDCAIWSNEPAFKEQSKINVLSTRDMIEIFS